MIYCADNLDVMRNLPSESIDLIYIDPPFFSNRVYETIWGDKNDTASFNDRWKGGIHHYCEWMRVRLEQMHRLLKPTGSFYCHLDWHAVHYIKVILDEIFGYNNFRSEIIWKRTAARGDSGNFPNIHDTILLYTKSNKYTFNKSFTDYDESYLKRYKHKDKKGNFLDRDLSAKGLSGGGYEYTWKGKNGLWRCPVSTMKRYEKEDRIYYTRNGTPRYKQYLHEMKGRAIQDIWTDINVINSQSNERVGYPTQKPVELLERIINTSSNDGDIVADFFCGCGTTLVAAHNLNRDYIGVDNSPMASKIIRKRLKGIGIDVPELAVKTLTKSQNNEAQAI